MKKNQHMILGVAVAILIAAGAYTACNMEVAPGAEEISQSPPIDMPGLDAGVPGELPDPNVDDPELDVDDLGERVDGVGVGGTPDDPRPILPAADPPTLEQPSLDGPQAGELNLRGPIACGGDTCEAGEMCCAAEGRCVPEDTPEACNGEDDRPGPAVIGMPETNPVE